MCSKNRWLYFIFGHIIWIIYESFHFSYTDCNGLIVPQELPSVLSLVYSNIPPIKKGTDSRVGFGFRLGEHADFQVLFELGPQKFTKPLGMWSKDVIACAEFQLSLLKQLFDTIVSILGKGASSDDDSDTSKRMVDQTDYSKKEKVSTMSYFLKIFLNPITLSFANISMYL